MIERELTAEEIYQKKINDEFERLKNLPHKEAIVPQEIIEREVQNAIKQEKIRTIKEKLKELTYDLIQAQAGALFEDLEERKAEFQTLHNELRTLLGKEPRKYLEEL